MLPGLTESEEADARCKVDVIEGLRTVLCYYYAIQPNVCVQSKTRCSTRKKKVGLVEKETCFGASPLQTGASWPSMRVLERAWSWSNKRLEALHDFDQQLIEIRRSMFYP